MAPVVFTSERGIWAVGWSLLSLIATAVLQFVVAPAFGSAALIADRHPARTDALTSLSVLLGAVGVRLDHPLADPVVGALICFAILRIVRHAGKAISIRLLDGVDPYIAGETRQLAGAQPQVTEITGVRLRWLGQRLHAELNFAVDPGLSVRCAHVAAVEVRHQLLHHLRCLSEATIHVDPARPLGRRPPPHHRPLSRQPAAALPLR